MFQVYVCVCVQKHMHNGGINIYIFKNIYIFTLMPVSKHYNIPQLCTIFMSVKMFKILFFKCSRISEFTYESLSDNSGLQTVRQHLQEDQEMASSRVNQGTQRKR